MLEPSRLPFELFLMVIDYATDRVDDAQALSNYSLVSSRWSAALNTRLYSRWLYDGEYHSISSLWKFLRTILCSRRIADSVQGLDIRNWTFGLVHGRSRLSLTEDDLDLVRNAVHMAGLMRIELSILEALRKADPRALMALLLANLRNLTTLYAHLPETDIFLTEVLRKAVESPQDQPQNDYRPLYRLREAHLTSAWNYRRDFRAHDVYKLELNHLWPVFQLPNLQSLSVFDLEPLGASNHFGNSFKTTTITDLTLVYRDDSLLTASDTFALLTLPRKLNKLSIYLNDCDLFKNNQQISNTELWNNIRQYEDCLEHLDIYRDCTGCSPPSHSANNSHFGSMEGFKRLKTLCIQPEVLLGGCCGDKMTPYPLKDVLPLSLRYLIFYGDEGLSLNKTLGQQLKEAIASPDFSLLDHVALEMTLENIHCYIDPADPPHAEVEQTCRERDIKYETKQASSCTKGGLGCRYYKHTVKKRLQNKKLHSVRYALTEYLSRLGEPAYQGGGSTGDRPHLSSDNLDTYELPWDELTEAALYPNWRSDMGYEGPFSEDEDLEPSDLEDTEDTDPEDMESDNGNSEDTSGDAGEYDSDFVGLW